MPRPRAGETSGATCLLLFRVLTFLVALASFGVLIYIAVARNITYRATYAAPPLSMAVNLWEIIPMLDKSRKLNRLRPSFLIGFDTFIYLFCAGVIIEAVAIVFREIDNDDSVFDNTWLIMFVLIILIAVIGGLHLAFSISDCVYYCGRKRTRRMEGPMRMEPSKYSYVQQPAQQPSVYA